MVGNTTLAAYLSDHPKLTGALLTILLLLTQAGTAIGNKVTYGGP